MIDQTQEYFERRDTPSRKSPVGNLMVRIMDKFPDISFDDARSKAHELLKAAAKRRNYQTPAVLSNEELERRKVAFDDLKHARRDVSRSDVATLAAD